MKKKNGFTMIELLAAIVIVTLLLSISVFTVNNIIEKSKDKSSIVSIDNIKKSANTYLKEYYDELVWEEYNNNLEKTCISVEMLINKGYLKNNIINNDKIPQSILVIKDKDNNIIKEEEQYTVCGIDHKRVDIPTKKNICNNIIYDGKQHHLINEGNKDESYSKIEYVNSIYNDDTNRPVNAGDYEVKVSLINGKKWTDNTNTPKTVTCEIKKAEPILIINPTGNADTEEEIGTTKDIVLTSNVGGTLELKVSNNDHVTVSMNNNSMEVEPSDSNIFNKIIKIKTIASKKNLTYITITLKSNNPNYKNGSIKYTIGKIKLKRVEKPTSEESCNDLTYNASVQTLAKKNVAYRYLNNTAIDYDTYTVTALLNYGFIWTDDTYEPVEFDCTIKRPKPTITYKDAICNPGSKVVIYEDTYGTLCIPTKTGYAFKGWYTDNKLTNQVTSSSIVKIFTNHNLYAKWVDETPPTCSITYRNGENNWVPYGVDITVNCYDNGSGCTSTNYNDVTSDKTYTVRDGAGNSATCTLDITSRTLYAKRTRDWIEQCDYNCAGGYVCAPSGAGTALCTPPLESINGRCCKFDETLCDFKNWYGCYSSWTNWSDYTDLPCSNSNTVECSVRYEYKKNS